MPTIDPDKRIQKIRTEEEIRKALSNLIHRKHTMTVPPQVDDDDIVLYDAFKELLDTRKTLDTTDWEKLSYEQKRVVNDFRARIGDILKENLESFYQEHPDLVFSWGLSLNVFLRKDKQEMQEL